MEKLIEGMTDALMSAAIVREGVSRKEIEDVLITVLAKFLES